MKLLKNKWYKITRENKVFYTMPNKDCETKGYLNIDGLLFLTHKYGYSYMWFDKNDIIEKLNNQEVEILEMEML